jgi:hypothetical protein
LRNFWAAFKMCLHLTISLCNSFKPSRYICIVCFSHDIKTNTISEAAFLFYWNTGYRHQTQTRDLRFFELDESAASVDLCFDFLPTGDASAKESVTHGRSAGKSAEKSANFQCTQLIHVAAIYLHILAQCHHNKDDTRQSDVVFCFVLGASPKTVAVWIGCTVTPSSSRHRLML